MRLLNEGRHDKGVHGRQGAVYKEREGHGDRDPAIEGGAGGVRGLQKYLSIGIITY